MELPREELIGWISKQLGSGLRNVGGEGGMEKLVEQITSVYEIKKLIIKFSKQVSNLVQNSISEQWRAVEIRNQLVQAEYVLREKQMLMDQVEGGNFEKNNELILVKINDKIFTEFINHTRAELDTLNIDTVWNEVLSRYNEDLKTRKSEDEMLRMDSSNKDNNISSKRQAALEMYLHERFLVKQQRERREQVELELREKISRFACNLHAIRDLHRIKQVVDEQKLSHVNEVVEMEERQMEWRLIEDEIMLVREIKQVREKGELKCEKIKELNYKLNNVYLIEKGFVGDKKLTVDAFRKEISEVRKSVKDLESTISKFKSYLRHDERVRREEAKGVRE